MCGFGINSGGIERSGLSASRGLASCARALARALERCVAAAALLLLGSTAAYALNCSDLTNGILDGFAGDVAPSQIQIDANCTIRNFPASNPLGTNFSFMTQPGQTDERWLIIFDNVVHTGQMACNSVSGHHIWFVNGSSSAIQEGCQNLLIPVEKIAKANPDGQTTAAIGVPFTYKMTLPVLYDEGTGTVIDEFGSLNDLHGIVLVDDLNEAAVDLTYVSHDVYWEGSGAPVAYTFTNANGVLTFSGFPVVPAGDQIIIELTVVLDDSPTNVIGTSFFNTAHWIFGRLIDGVYYEPLPGENGVSEAMTVAGPNVVVTKSGPGLLNLGQSGDFTLDVHNVGNGDAWDVTLLDRLPDGPDGGMCLMTPQVLSAQVFAADGTTPVAGKGPLSEGTDYTLAFRPAPVCELEWNFVSAASVIGPDERLVIVYRTELDPDSANSVPLVNVAGAIEWFNAGAGVAGRQRTARTLSNGTVGIADHEDAHTVVTAISGVFFEKTVENLTSGERPAVTGAPGDRMRYTLRVQTTDAPLPTTFELHDDLGARNAVPVFEPGSLAVVTATLPPGADTSGTDPSAGTNGAGIIDVALPGLPMASEIQVQFDITVGSSVLDGTVVEDQSGLVLGGYVVAVSDDPAIGGQSDPDIAGDEDPTRFIIQRPPAPPLLKETTQPTATIGEHFTYRLTVPSTPHVAALYDVRILDDLGASAADLRYEGVTLVSGPAGIAPDNSGTGTALVIEDPANGIDIPAGQQVVLEITVVLTDTATNVAGLEFTNTAAYTYNQLDGDLTTQSDGEGGTSAAMTIVEPTLTLEKSGPLQMRIGEPGTFTLDIHNVGGSLAYGVEVVDLLPDQADGGTCDAAPAPLSVQLFQPDGTTPVAGPLVLDTDYTATWTGTPDCRLVLEMISPAAAVGPDQWLRIEYDTQLDADTQTNAAVTDIAGATRWFSLDPATANADARQYDRVITDGTVGVLDHEDAHTSVEYEPVLIFEKSVINVTSGENPATRAEPGDRLRYRLYLENAGTTPATGLSTVDELDALNAPAAFAEGSLSIVTLPAGADDTGTDANGGSAGTGRVEVHNLDLNAPGDSLVIEYEVTLAPAIDNGTIVLDQARLEFGGYTVAVSDDPNINGAADPNVAGDEDPTQVVIDSAPAFTIDKVSSYVTGDPTVLLAGEVLEYSVTVQNTGNENATGVILRDSVPVHTTYVAGSTTLNGTAVADAANGVSPLADGMLVSAPQDPTPGVMNAAVANNVATVTFQVLVASDVADGTILSNQAFVSAPDQGIGLTPSDDPRTALVDDPTRDVVGNLPLLFATKSARLQVDNGSPGVVDPGDTLHYTITVYNQGAVAATGVAVADDVPANTTYVADSLLVNGTAPAGSDAGLFPLSSGVALSSDDLTPPLPGAGEGVFSPGGSGTVEFDLLVDAGVAAGTLITNQAVVASAELVDLPTDGDGDPTTGPEPTIVVVGDSEQVILTKQIVIVGGGAALPGTTVEYIVTARNVGTVPVYNVVITDDLDEPVAGQLIYTSDSATLDGFSNGVSVTGSSVIADFFATNGALPAGASTVLRFRATLANGLAEGTTVTNIGRVTYSNPPQSAEDSVSIDVGGVPGTGTLNGTVWRDINFNDTADPGENLLEGWDVTLWLGANQVRATVTGSNGRYTFAQIAPSDAAGGTYSVRFSAPGASAGTAALGRAASPFTNGLQRIDDIPVTDGSNLLGLDLPIDPNGVVYDSMARTPVRGAVVTLLEAVTGAPLPTECFEDPAQQNQVTGDEGYYKFDLQFGNLACPSGGAYLINVTPPGSGYVAGVSTMIPADTDSTSAPFDVPACPGGADDAILSTAQYCEVQASPYAPSMAVPARTAGTRYHLHLRLDDSAPPGSAQLYNNHIPLDPDLTGALTISKRTPKLDVTRGELVPYTITIHNSSGLDLRDVNIVDHLPAGFTYVKDSARIDGAKEEPTLSDRELVWANRVLTGGETHTVQLVLAVGAGVLEGEFVNRATVESALTGAPLTGEATATVRLVPDPSFDCADVTGKVFDDTNRNGYQDPGEQGIGGVRLVTARGLAATTDASGRYHFTCASMPNEARGSNFVLKLDDRTLPTGFRLSTGPVATERATRGKMLRINFGASLGRVVGLDLADAVFEPGTTEMRSVWRPRLERLLTELRKAPSILRLSYLAEREPKSLVDERLKVLGDEITKAWQDLDGSYDLSVESEVFWRLGASPKERGLEGNAP